MTARATLVLDRLAAWTRSVTVDGRVADAVCSANTARQAFDILKNQAPEVIPVVGRRIIDAASRFADHRLAVRSIIFDYDGQVAFDSNLAGNEDAHG